MLLLIFIPENHGICVQAIPNSGLRKRPGSRNCNCVDVFMGTRKMFITVFLCLDWWVVDWWYFTIFMFCCYWLFYVNV